jgi:hypothetical protein
MALGAVSDRRGDLDRFWVADWGVRGHHGGRQEEDELAMAQCALHTIGTKAIDNELLFT